MQQPNQQTSKVLPTLFEHIDPERRVSVLHIGPAMQDTLDFFSAYRCRLHIANLFDDLPLSQEEDAEQPLAQRIEESLQLPAESRFDICLFWDLFNYLERDAVMALLKVLRPHLKPRGLAHALSVHNPRSAPVHHLYGIGLSDSISVRDRPAAPPDYAPHNQSRLKDLLALCFGIERSVLLPDGRLELLLRAR